MDVGADAELEQTRSPVRTNEARVGTEKMETGLTRLGLD